MCGLFWKMSQAHWKIMCVLFFLGRMLCIYFVNLVDLLSCLNLLFPYLCLLHHYWEQSTENSTTILREMSISLFNSISFCFMYFDGLLLGVIMFLILYLFAILNLLFIYNYLVSCKLFKFKSILSDISNNHPCSLLRTICTSFSILLLSMFLCLWFQSEILVDSV